MANRPENTTTKRLFFAEHLYREEMVISRVVSICLAVAVFLAVVVGGLFFISDYSSRIEQNSEAEAQTIMGDISTQVSGNIVSSIDSWFAQLEMASGLLSQISSDTYDYSNELNNSLLEITRELSFNSVGLILQNGDLYYVNEENGSGVYYNIAAESVARSVTLEGKRYVGRISITGVGEQIIFGIPFNAVSSETTYDDASPDRISGIAGLIDPYMLSRIMYSSAFNGSAYLALIQSDGGNIVDTYYETEQESSLYNMFNIVKDNFSAENLGIFIEEISSGTSASSENYGVLSGTFEGEAALYYYANPEEENWPDDWRIMIVVKRSYIMQNISLILNDTMVVTYIMFGVIAVILFGIAVAYCLYKQKSNQLKYVDPVTGGINETRFKMDANVLIDRHPEVRYALVNINVSRRGFNYESGDRSGLLKTAYKVIGDSINENELYARMSSDRFSLLVNFGSGSASENRIAELVKNIQRICSEKLIYNIQAFTGVYVIPEGENNVSDIIDKAKVARRSASIDHPIVYFSDKMLLDMRMEEELEHQQQVALDEQRFCVFYQLKRDIQNNVWSGSEALVRWRDPKKGLISPGMFIPLFEKNGFVLKLDLYVFECVCRDIKQLLDKGLEPLPVSVNISRRHLAVEGFFNEYEKLIAKYGIPTHYIEFELTESMMIDDSHRILKLVKDIHAVGCTCSIDDFGSGYSSLSMLKEYDFDVIKLDGSFFYGKTGFDDKTKKIVGLLVELSHKLGKKVVAEGVETQEQVNFLTQAGCDFVQGYFFARPCPLKDNVKVFAEKDLHDLPNE